MQCHVINVTMSNTKKLVNAYLIKFRKKETYNEKTNNKDIKNIHVSLFFIRHF
jgi:hypothetical protein